jgi:hypothetical protein
MSIVNEAESVVRGWFKDARKGMWVGINLWYPPNSDAWGRLTTHVIHRGVDTGLVEFEGSFYRVTYGPGDCEENLHWVGDVG